MLPGLNCIVSDLLGHPASWRGVLYRFSNKHTQIQYSKKLKSRLKSTGPVPLSHSSSFENPTQQMHLI